MNSYQMVLHRPVETARIFSKLAWARIRGGLNFARNAAFHADRLTGQKCRRNRRGTLSIARPSPRRRYGLAQVFINAAWPLQYLRKSRIKRIGSGKTAIRSALLKKCLRSEERRVGK